MEPYEGREPYIFISYARKDKEEVLPYLDALSGAGYRLWYDKGIKAGDEWLKTLEEKVKHCEVFCPIFSQAFNDSYYCFRETSYACWRDKKIVPLYLEEVKDGFRLLFRLLKYLQHLRLDDCAPTQFAERLDGEQAFKDCKKPCNVLPEGWQKFWQIQWRLSVDGVLTIAQNEDMPKGFHRSASIPDYQHNYYGVSTAPWIPYKKEIFSVIIGKDIGTIGDSAFMGCKSLMNVHIPDSVTKIGDDAFSDCRCLTDVRIPDSVTQIGDNAFANCWLLKSVEIPARAKVSHFAFPDKTLVTRRAAP